MNCGPSGKEVRLKPGLLLSCNGCCCGEKNRDAEALERLIGVLKEGFKSAGIEKEVRLARTECLGPCGEKNVFHLTLFGEGVWLGRMDRLPLIEALRDYVVESVRQGHPGPLPSGLAEHAFVRYATTEGSPS